MAKDNISAQSCQQKAAQALARTQQGMIRQHFMDILPQFSWSKHSHTCSKQQQVSPLAEGLKS